MKNHFTLMFLFISIMTFAQQGINYKAVINETNGAPLANTFMNVQFTIHESTATGTIVYQEDYNYTTDADGLVILNIGSDPTPSIGSFSTLNWGSALHFLQTTIVYSGGTIDFDATQFMAVPYALNAANVSGLERITEGVNNGYRLVNSDPLNYNSIGQEAVDLSISQQISETAGASGFASFASGLSTEASGDYSIAMGNNVNARSFSETAIGNFNTSYSPASTTSWNSNDRLFNIGNGIENSDRNDALTILKNGTITAPSFDIAEITNPKALITKEYADANYNDNQILTYDVLGENLTISGGNSVDLSSLNVGLERLNEGNGIGWRLAGQNSSNFGNIGLLAVDLSFSNTSSGIRGATGFYSFATGENTIASGDTSTAMGLGTIASGFYSLALGRYNIDNPNALLMVGNGNITARATAFTVLLNGNVGIGNHQPSSLFEVAHRNGNATSESLSILNTDTNNTWQFHTTNYLNLFRNGEFKGSWNATSGAYVQASDRRVKKDITPLETGTLHKVLQLNPVSYLMKDQTDTKRNLGLISQEVQEIFPSITQYVEESNLLALSYTELIPILIKALQEQQAIIDNRTSRIENLEATLIEKETVLSTIDTQIKTIGARLKILELEKTN